MNVSVVVLTYNSQRTIKRCLQALLNQTYHDFELVVVDDGSSDQTLSIISWYNDPRIRLVRNEKNLGIAKSRNIGWKNSKGSLVFFTDSDCTPMLNWLEEGVQNLQKVGDFITGVTFYENARTSLRHKIVQGRDLFYTCNLGFKRKILEAVDGFDEKLSMYAEDKDICFRILKQGGKKTFCENMVVVHLETFRAPSSELRHYRNFYCGKIRCQIKNGQENGIYFRIMRPDHLLKTIFPLLMLITERVNSVDDLKLIPFTWLGMARGRIAMWGTCMKQGKFYV